MDEVIRYMPLLLQGAKLTLLILFGSALISMSCGLFFGIAMAQACRIPILSPFVESLTFLLRAIPFYVQLLLVYFVLPEILGLNLDGLTASIIALGLCSSGYVAHIIRGGINAIEPEQWQCAAALGYGRRVSLRYAILPQVLRNSLPMLGNELESILKSTAIAASIGVLELTRAGANIVSRELNPMLIYSTVALFYVAISAAFQITGRLVYARS